MNTVFYSLEGNHQRLDGGAMFGNAPKALWSRWLQADENNCIQLSCRSLLVTGLNGLTVLFEAGVGLSMPPELQKRYGVIESEHVLLESLDKLNISPEQIDVIVLSHLHFDHAGGLLKPWKDDKPAELAFPKARILVSRDQWQRALHPHPRDKASYLPYLQTALLESGQLEWVEAETHPVLGESVRFIFSHGHTPGMMLSVIQDKMVFCADLIPGCAWAHLPITMGYDRCAETVIDEKTAFLEQTLSQELTLFFTHDFDVPAARLQRDEKQRYQAVPDTSLLDNL